MLNSVSALNALSVVKDLNQYIESIKLEPSYGELLLRKLKDLNEGSDRLFFESDGNGVMETDDGDFLLAYIPASQEYRLRKINPRD